jgi:hypothetical protein
MMRVRWIASLLTLIAALFSSTAGRTEISPRATIEVAADNSLANRLE